MAACEAERATQGGAGQPENLRSAGCWARVIRGLGGLYCLEPLPPDGATGRDQIRERERLWREAPERWEQALLLAKPRGIFRKDGRQILPGDLVRYEAAHDPDIPWVITAYQPRRSLLLRPPVANLDGLAICFACREPAPDLLLLDKLILMARLAQLDILILFTKTDQLTPGERTAFRAGLAAYERGFTCLMLGRAPGAWTKGGQGTGQNAAVPGPEQAGDDAAAFKLLTERLRGKIWAFCGPSGVGKSTLFNRLMGRRHMAMGAISRKMGRGRQTTRHVELAPSGGAYLLDTPGFEILDLAQLAGGEADLIQAYPEFADLSTRCRFTACRHLREPDCAVKIFAASAPAYWARYRRYEALAEELETLRRSRYR